MASLTDLFNPTFLMFLGILVLVVALLVVYFESKMRDQNHKIASMLSLVSTLADDMNGVKMGLNHLALRGGSSFQQPTNYENKNNLGNKQTLIEVSDDEDDDDNMDEDEDDEDENTEADDYESDDSKEDTKVIKLQVSNEEMDDDDTYEIANNLEFDPESDLADFELDYDDETSDIKVNNDYVEGVLDLKYEDIKESVTLEEKTETLEENIIPQSTELKTISINLGDNHDDEVIDYKKLQLSKLRSIVVEKGFISNSEASKLKKPELLKWLGVE